MDFLDTTDLRTDEIWLRLTKAIDAQPEKRWLPAYYFDICLPDGTKIGNCDLRIGHNEKTYIGGNIGYRIDKAFRGHHYASEACRLLFRLAEKHGMDHLIITCLPENRASARTCELAGGKFLGIEAVPEDNEMYEDGARQVMLYHFDIRHRTLIISKLSEKYSVRLLTENDLETVCALCRENPQYYEYCPPFVTSESIRQDMKALPPGISSEDKHYLGYFDGAQLIAVLDLINGYPHPETAFIGFFMTERSVQGQGVGSAIISELCDALKEQGFTGIRLCRAEGNPQPKAFWRKNGFTEIGMSYNTNGYTVTVMQKIL